METYSSREVIKILRRAGWIPLRQKGSHLHFVHPEKPGKVTVPHPKSDIVETTLRSILSQAGLTESEIDYGGGLEIG